MNDTAQALRCFFDAYNARDPVALARAVDPSVQLSRPGQTVRGRADLLTECRWDWEDLPDCRVEVKTTISEGSRVAAELTWLGTNTSLLHLPGGGIAPPTGESLELDCVAIGEVRDGLLAVLRIYWDNAALLQQLGLLPPPG